MDKSADLCFQKLTCSDGFAFDQAKGEAASDGFALDQAKCEAASDGFTLDQAKCEATKASPFFRKGQQFCTNKKIFGL